MLHAASVVAFLSVLGSASAAQSSPPAGSVVTSPRTDLTAPQILTTGVSFLSGSINANLIWQSSGALAAGGCPTPNGYTIKSCYAMSLTPTGQLESTIAAKKRDLASLEELAARRDFDLAAYFAAFPEQRSRRNSKRNHPLSHMKNKRLILNPKGRSPLVANPKLNLAIGGLIPDVPTTTVASILSSLSLVPTLAPTSVPTSIPVTGGRQRIEIMSWPGAAANERWTYSWTTYTEPGLATSVHYNHAWQMLRRDKTGGPVITLDYKVDKVVIGDIVAGCVACVVAPLSSWLGVVVVHSLAVTWGPDGKVTYSAADVKTPSVPLIAYSATHDMGSSASIKFGMYRLVVPGATSEIGYVGDYVATRLA